MAKNLISQFVKKRRRLLKLTQLQLSKKAGVGLRLIRELEQGKESLRMDKVNQVLGLFGFLLGPVRSSPGEISRSEGESDE